MFLELRHLRSLLAISETGNLSAAAERMHITQSALSHQIKGLERYFEVELFLRSTKPLRITPAGAKIVEAAKNCIPVVVNLEQDLRRLASGESGRLHIAIECHACFEWLMPVLDKFRIKWPEIEVDIRLGISFDPLPALQKGEVDAVIISDKLDLPDIIFQPLFEYEALAVLSETHILAEKKYLEPEDFRPEILITYPVDRSRLDIFKYYLQPAAVEPLQIRQAELTAVILMLVANQRGIAALPDWVLNNSYPTQGIIHKPLGVEGMHGTLYLAMRKNDVESQYMQQFVGIAREAKNRKQGGRVTTT